MKLRAFFLLFLGLVLPPAARAAECPERYQELNIDRYAPHRRVRTVSAAQIEIEDQATEWILNKMGVGFTEAPDVEPKLLRELREKKSFLKGEGHPQTFGRLLVIDRLPPPSSIALLRNFLRDPRLPAYLARMHALGYDLAVDSTLRLSRAGGYFNPRDRLIALGPFSSWREFTHEFQHLEFEETIRAHFALMLELRRQKRDLDSVPALVEKIGVEKLRVIQALIDQGVSTPRAVNESLSFAAETAGKSPLTNRYRKSRMYMLRHQITDLRGLGPTATPQQRAYVAWASAEHDRLQRWNRRITMAVALPVAAAGLAGAAKLGEMALGGSASPEKPEFSARIGTGKGEELARRVSDGIWVCDNCPAGSPLSGEFAAVKEGKGGGTFAVRADGSRIFLGFLGFKDLKNVKRGKATVLEGVRPDGSRRQLDPDAF